MRNIVGTRAEAMVDEQTHNCSPILSAAPCFRPWSILYLWLVYYSLLIASSFHYEVVQKQVLSLRMNLLNHLSGLTKRHEEPTHQLLDLVGEVHLLAS